MKLHPTSDFRGLPPAEDALVRYLCAHAEALLNAAALLGDRPAVRRTARLFEELAETRQPLTRRQHAGIRDLHRLLSLEGVDDPDSLEAACFAEIDPASPVVEEICLLTDGLASRLAALRQAEGQPFGMDLSAAA